MATWQMLKREKMNGQQRQAAFGSYVRRSDNATKPVPRDGKAQRLPERDPQAMPFWTQAREENLPVACYDGVVVQRLEAGKAAGLREDVGAMGKGKRVAFKSCGGNGTRIKQGLTPESYTYVTELVSNRS